MSIKEVHTSQIHLSPEDLKLLLVEAAKLGAQQIIETLVSYNFKDAAKQIGITPKTLNKRILQGKIKAVDGRISGLEIQRYLQAK